MIVEYIRNFVQKYDSYEIYEKYSGKGMFGRHCIGIIVKRGSSYMDCLIKTSERTAFRLICLQIMRATI